MLFYLIFLLFLFFLVCFILLRWIKREQNRRRTYSVGFSMKEPDIEMDEVRPQKLIDLESEHFGDDENEELSEVDEELDYDT